MLSCPAMLSVSSADVDNLHSFFEENVSRFWVKYVQISSKVWWLACHLSILSANIKDFNQLNLKECGFNQSDLNEYGFDQSNLDEYNFDQSSLYEYGSSALVLFHPISHCILLFSFTPCYNNTHNRPQLILQQTKRMLFSLKHFMQTKIPYFNALLT